MKIILYAVTALMLQLPTALRAEPTNNIKTPEQLLQFKGFLFDRQAALSKLSTFWMDGTVQITLSDEFMKEQNSGDALKSRINNHGEAPAKENLQYFCISGNGDTIKQFIVSVDKTGTRIGPATTYYLNSKQVIVVDGEDENNSSVFPLAKGPNYGLFNCPAFLEYSFLLIDVGRYGPRALRTTDLSSNVKWENAIQSLQAVSLEKRGIVHATISGTDGFCTVDLIHSPSGNNKNTIRTVSFFNRDRILTRTIEVSDYFHDASIGDIGKKMKMRIFGISKENGPGVTWEFRIDNIRLNDPRDKVSLKAEAIDN